MRRPSGGTDESRLGDRRVDHPALTKASEQPVGDLEGSAISADVLSEEKDTFVPLHLLEEGLTNGFEVRRLSH
jgi:hypothetical protein